MSILPLIFAEIRFRFVNFVLCTLAIVVAATMYMAGPMLLTGYASHANAEIAELDTQAKELEETTVAAQAEMDAAVGDLVKKTRRIMRDIGVNLRIVHKETNLGGLYTDFVAHEFPEEYVHKLATAESIETIVHLVATLQHKTKWNDRTVLVVGTLPVLTNSQKNEEKPHMVKPVKQGTVLVGSELVGDLKEGDAITIEDVELTIAKLMPEQGTQADVQLVMHLDDAQTIANKPDQINQIMALNCKCKGDRISVIRKELEGVLPDTKVTEDASRATAREQERDLTEAFHKQQVAEAQANLQRVQKNTTEQRKRHRSQQSSLSALIGIGTPATVLIAGLIIALMTWQNVRERREEIGVLRALGKATSTIASLLLGKAAIVGLLGGVVGCLIGIGVAHWIANAMQIESTYMTPNAILIATTILGAPLIAAMASYLPTLSAVTQDPASILVSD